MAVMTKIRMLAARGSSCMSKICISSFQCRLVHLHLTSPAAEPVSCAKSESAIHPWSGTACVKTLRLPRTATISMMLEGVSNVRGDTSGYEPSRVFTELRLGDQRYSGGRGSTNRVEGRTCRLTSGPLFHHEKGEAYDQDLSTSPLSCSSLPSWWIGMRSRWEGRFQCRET